MSTARPSPMLAVLRTSLAAGFALTTASVLTLASLEALAADGPATAAKNAPVKLEAVPGAPYKKITLTQRAAERLGIETGKVAMGEVARRQMVGGVVVRPVEKSAEPRQAPGGFSLPGPAGGGFGAPGGAFQQTTANVPAATQRTDGEVWIQVSLSRTEWDRLAKDRPVRLLPLGNRDDQKPVTATPAPIDPVEDMRRSMLNVYYVVPGKDHGLTLNRRMRVELSVTGESGLQKVVPYGAIYYDARGTAWVYVNPGPLTYHRQKVTVERIVGDVAVLSEGPDEGAAIVTTGASLLFGTEVFGK